MAFSQHHPMTSERPILSIGMPVYNAGKHLSGALASLLAQNFSDFRLFISDNASTDDTEAICRHYAALDPRVDYRRNTGNIGAAANFNKVFADSAPSTYFMWAAHDDAWHPDYVGRCIAALEERPQAVLCVSEIEFIGQNGAPALDIPPDIRNYNRVNTVGLDRRQRVKALTERINWYAFYGVIRRDSLSSTALVRSCYGADTLLLMELLLQGETLVLPEKLFSYRIEEKSAAMQVEALSGSAVPVSRVYTTLASDLLELARPAGAEFVSDLLENITRGVWREQLINENSLQRYRAPELLAAEINLLVDRRLSVLQAWSIRTAAATRYVRNMPPVKSIKVRIKLALDGLGLKRWTFYPW